MDVVKFADARSIVRPITTALPRAGCRATTQAPQTSPGSDISVFPLRVVMPMEAGPIGKIYVVTQRVLTFVLADWLRHRLEQWDSIFIPAGEARVVDNHSGAPAAIIVVTTPPTLK